MMEVLFFIAIGWLIITMVGHLTWVVAATIFRLFFNPKSLYPPAPPPQTKPDNWSRSTSQRPEGSQAHGSSDSSDEPPSAASDLAAFSRMLDALTVTDQLEVEVANRLKASAQKLATKPETPAPEPIAEPTLPAADTPQTAITPAAHAEAQPTEVAPPIAEPVFAEPVVAEAVTAEVVYDPPVPSTPKRALSEVITSFLARNNIRWGELVAGLLVVVCSIGLVVSLWNPLSSAHRVVPSLIFMSADAAIFAAGLYTVRRWKLRHTSRAVLIIATLLVPLCVLAGMAAAG
ncbi:MAG: hypothetical protein CMM00_08625, partial [Rhodopirellula sp.]|nr:hypothetical protein [Rhodopirellula sp.]